MPGTLEALVMQIGRAREERSRRTPLRRDESAFPADAVAQGRASFCIELEAIVGALDAAIPPTHERVALPDAVDAAMNLLSRGIYGFVGAAILGVLTLPRWYAERSMSSRSLLRATAVARQALDDLLAPATPANGFEEGWRLEARALRGALQELTEAAARPDLDHWRMRHAFRRALEQALILLEPSRYEFDAWRHVTTVLESARARNDRDELQALVDAAERQLGARPNLLSEARIIERALAPGARHSSMEELTAGIHQRPGPPSPLFVAS